MIDRLRWMTADAAASLERLDAAEYPGIDAHVAAWRESTHILSELQTADDVREVHQVPDVLATVEDFRNAMYEVDVERAIERSRPALQALNGIFEPNGRYITAFSALPGPIKRRRRKAES